MMNPFCMVPWQRAITTSQSLPYLFFHFGREPLRKTNQPSRLSPTFGAETMCTCFFLLKVRAVDGVVDPLLSHRVLLVIHLFLLPCEAFDSLIRSFFVSLFFFSFPVLFLFPLSQ